MVEGNSAIIYRLQKNCTGCTILYLVVNSFVKLFRVEARHANLHCGTVNGNGA